MAGVEGDFTSIPTLDLSLASSPSTKPQFLSELRNALVRVGFFYVKNHSILAQTQQDAIEQSFEFFALPLEKKLEVATVHSKHFLGYNSMGAESTSAQTDYNESIAVGADRPGK
jgi:isopenicillin N synthase-like dioxygenase